MSFRERTQNPVVGDTIKLRLFVYNSNQRRDVFGVNDVNIYYLDPELVSEDNLDGRRLIQSIPGPGNYQGGWDALTNAPILASGVGTTGEWYVVSAAGTTTLDGITTWAVGDQAVFDGTVWMKILTAEVIEVVHEAEGEYSVTIPLTNTKYVIGSYRDQWGLEIEELQPESNIENKWRILPDLWYIGPEPFIYDFSFGFRPNRFRVCSKQYITIDVRPNVPTATDMERYYTALGIASTMKISIEMACGDCLPAERDLRLIVDRDELPIRKMCEGYYFLDTEALELNCGIYNVWFEMDIGESRYISEKYQLEIYD
jgi:hypothetical protein